MRARWPVRKRLAELLERSPLLAGVTVSPVPPNDLSVSSEHIWCAEASGEFVAGPNVAGRQVNEDVFTVTVRVLTKRGETHDECMSRLGELVGAVYDVIADGEVDGLALVDWGVDDDWECQEVTPGPFTDAPGTDKDKKFPFASAEVGVDFEVRYFGGNR